MTLLGIPRQIYIRIAVKGPAQCFMRPQTKQPHVLVLFTQLGGEGQVVQLMRILLTSLAEAT